MYQILIVYPRDYIGQDFHAMVRGAKYATKKEAREVAKITVPVDRTWRVISDKDNG